MVIDDDPYGMLRFEGEPVPTLHELAEGDPLVFSVRTFSKIIAPGLRVGWVDTAPELQQLLINAKQAMDTCTNHPMQRLLARFLSGGHLDAHLETQRAEYRRRKRALQQALEEHFSGRARWTDPEGGFFLWVTFEPHRRHRGALPDRARAGRGIHPRQRLLTEQTVSRCAAALLRHHTAGAHRGRREPPRPRRRPPHHGLMGAGC